MKTDDGVSSPRDFSTDIMLEILRLRGKLLDKGDDLVAPLGSTSSDWRLLGAVALARQPLAVPMIADAMGITRQGTQKHMNKMVERGLFRQEPNPKLPRSPVYVLGERGEAAFGSAMTLHDICAGELSRDLRAGDLATTLSVLREIGRRLESVALPRARDVSEASAGAAPTRRA